MDSGYYRANRHFFTLGHYDLENTIGRRLKLVGDLVRLKSHHVFTRIDWLTILLVPDRDASRTDGLTGRRHHDIHHSALCGSNSRRRSCWSWLRN